MLNKKNQFITIGILVLLIPILFILFKGTNKNLSSKSQFVKRNTIRKDLSQVGTIVTHHNESVQRRISDEENWSSITGTQEVYNSDFIHSSGNSKSILKFKDSGEVQIGDNTLFQVYKEIDLTNLFISKGSLVIRQSEKKYISLDLIIHKNLLFQSEEQKLD